MQKETNIINFKIDEFIDGTGGWTYDGKHYDDQTLRLAAEGLEIFDIPLAGIDLATKPWTLNNFRWIIYHMKRINDANLDYPIILDPDGTIIDGWHRIGKAMINGEQTIKARRLRVMPSPDSITTITN